ncbi:DUF3304 domain-containing protein [Duganella dendranthematis]|uniref:DUF3304 domain-containing protein n=1 Tax=Duganella dendranthematis TaxID=2728021 RepID=A0ABX6M7J1_9BURK|nr:DUF3304 domain-containing protein [Duganella dendranthematis]QJD90292.1 DUF3304 domain-containing protein [Duganella dendranthematis]
MKSYLTRVLLVTAAAIVLWFGYTEFLHHSRSTDFTPAGITGVQHLGNGYLISSFYVDKYGGDSVGRDGGGGSIVCCAMLPLKWRPGLAVEVRWRVEDWTRENRAEIDAGNYQSVTEKGVYIAKVPIEQYDEPHDLYVHFFPRGRVRVLSTKYSVSSPVHPVLFGQREGGLLATAGLPIRAIFSPSELAEISKRSNPWK